TLASGLRQRRLRRAGPLRVGHVVAVAGVLPVDDGQRRAALAQQLASLLAHARAPLRPSLRLEARVLAARERLDLLRDAHAAPVVAAQGADGGVDLQVPVVGRRGAGARGLGRADGAGDVVVAGEGVGHEGAEDVEGGIVADLLLDAHVPRDLVERHVAGTLDHRLHAGLARALHELAERAQLG